MLKMELKAGGTFAYAGIVQNLDPSVAWAASADVQIASTRAPLDTLAVTLAQAGDWSTSGNWNISLFASSTQTAAWWTATKNLLGRVVFDLKFYNSVAPDPVLHSETVALQLWPEVTP